MVWARVSPRRTDSRGRFALRAAGPKAPQDERSPRPRTRAPGAVLQVVDRLYTWLSSVSMALVDIRVRREMCLAMRAGSQPHRAMARRSNRGHRAIARICAGHISGARGLGRCVWMSTCLEIAIDRLPVRGPREGNPASMPPGVGRNAKRATDVFQYPLEGARLLLGCLFARPPAG